MVVCPLPNTGLARGPQTCQICSVIIICPFVPYGPAHVLNILSNWYQQGPHFAGCSSLKPLDRYFPFQVLGNCRGLLLCNVIVTFRFGPYGLTDRPEYISLKLLDRFFAVRSAMKLSLIVVAHQHGVLPIWPVWPCLLPAEPYGLINRLQCISLKLWDGFYRFYILWNYLYLQ